MTSDVVLNRKTVKPRGGKREDLNGLYCRSAMEADFYRILQWLQMAGAVKAWASEPCVIGFTDFGYKRGPWAYTPDAVVWWEDVRAHRDLQNILPGHRPTEVTVEPMEWFNLSGPGRGDVGFGSSLEAHGRFEYFEVKGREIGSDRSKMKRLKKHYPHIHITKVGTTEWKGLGEFFGPLIPGWETRFRTGRRRR